MIGNFKIKTLSIVKHEIRVEHKGKWGNYFFFGSLRRMTTETSSYVL